MLIASGVDVRTVASYLGHSNVAVTLNTYAEVDPDAKRAAAQKIQEAFDVDYSKAFPLRKKATAAHQFSVAELEAMLEEARMREAS